MTGHKFGLSLALLLLISANLYAQTFSAQISGADTLVVNSRTQYSSVLEGADIFAIMPATVKLHQSMALRSAVYNRIANNESRMFNGFRIRVFHDNSQSARSRSAAIESSFRRSYPEFSVDRTYDNQYFNVTIGAFRTKSEAEKMLRQIQTQFSDATIVMGRFKYPMLEACCPVILIEEEVEQTL